MVSNSFESFIKETFVTDEYKIKGCFSFENGNLYVVSNKYKILFPFHYEDNLYQTGIELAKQLLDVTEEIERLK